MSKNVRQNVWTNYWNNNIALSCDDGIKSENSDISEFWAQCSQKINQNSMVLDLCTGKGAVIASLITHQLQKDDHCSFFTGVDISDLKDTKFAEQIVRNKDRVKFLYNTSVESIPLSDKCMDLITSQFGIEYQYSEETLAEIFRLLKDDGSIEFVVHHSESVMIEVAKEELQHIQLLLNKNGFIECLSNLIPFYAMLKNPANLAKVKKSKKANDTKEAFNVLSQEIIQRIEQNSYTEILQTALNVSNAVLATARKLDAAQAKQVLKHFVSELNDSKVRSKELIGSAFNEEKIINLKKDLHQYNRSVIKYSTLYSNGKVVAWGISIQ